MPQRIAVCSDCARERKIQARGLCNSCLSRYYQQFPNIVCASCGEEARNCARGLCHKCWQQHRKAGDLDRFAPRPRIRLEDRLNAIRGEPDECWPWQWRTNYYGYGTLVIRGVSYQAHRLAYEMWVGPIPEGLVIDHTCHNADAGCTDWDACPHHACCNPAHLETVPSGINTLRGHTPAGDNARKTHCDKGHEFTPDNTYYPPGGRERVCKTCRRIRCREWKRKKRAERRGVVYVSTEWPIKAA